MAYLTIILAFLAGYFLGLYKHEKMKSIVQKLGNIPKISTGSQTSTIKKIPLKIPEPEETEKREGDNRG